MYGHLKKQFERQDITYTSAGVFLHTLKTLMAKLKVGMIDIASFVKTLTSSLG